MSLSKPSKSSQGTDMVEFLRYQDAIAYDKIVKNCNRLAKPLGSRSVTNKCYILLWKATYFSSSVFIGVQHVQDTLVAMRENPVPCLVMLAADTFITTEMTDIVNNCKSRDIPYLFIPTKRAMRDALNVDNDVLVVLIAFNHDPGMTREFEDCYVSMRSQCYRKKRKREPSSHPTSPLTLPPEVGPGGEMPQQVNTEVSTVASRMLLSPPDNEAGTSSSSDWVTISSDSDFSDDSDLERGTSKDFSVNVPDESGSSFQEYVRIPSPTPAPSPSEMAARQKYELPSSAGDTTTAGSGSSDESLTAGPSRDFPVPTGSPRPHHPPHIQSTWPIALPYAPKEDFDDEKIKMYLQTISRKKKMRLRSKTSVPPMCNVPQLPLGQDFIQFVTYAQPSTTTQAPATSQSADISEPIDVDSDDITFSWTMDDLSSTSNEALSDSTSRPTIDDTIHSMSTDEDELMIDESTLKKLQREVEASGDDNVCPMDLSESSSAVSTATADLPTGEEAGSSLELPNMFPSTPFGLGDNAAITSTTSSEVLAPRASFHGLGDVRATPSSRTLADVQSITSFRASGELPDISSGDVSSSRGMEAPRSIPSFRGLRDLPPIPPFRGITEVSSTPSLRGSDDVSSDLSSVELSDSRTSSLGVARSVQSSGELSGGKPTPAVGGLGDIPIIPPFRGLGDIPPIPPFRRLDNSPSSSAFHELVEARSAPSFHGLGDISPIPPFNRPSDILSNPTSDELGSARSMPSSLGSGDVSTASSPRFSDSQAGPSQRMANNQASGAGGLGDAPAMPPPSAGDVPAVPAAAGEVGDAAVLPPRPRGFAGAGEGSSQMSNHLPSAFGDAWPIGVRNPNIYRHRVTGTGEGHQPAFMPINFNYVFAPRVVYTGPANQDGRRGLWNNLGMPREEDLLAIPLPGDEIDPDEGINPEQNPESDSNSMELNNSSDSSEESELSSDDSVKPPEPFEFDE